MLGDDLYATVVTKRFGIAFGRTRGDQRLCREVRWFDKRESKTRLVSERSMNAMEISEEWQLRADPSFKKTMPMLCE